MHSFEGQCHCGTVRFEVDTELDDPVWCNCSFCVRRGAKLQKVPADSFRLKAGEDRLSVYGNRDFSDHYFCSTCGIHTFTRTTRNDQDAVVVNLACLEGVDPDSLELRVFDGANLL